MASRQVPEKYTDLQGRFKVKELVWSLVHYGLGIAAAVLAFLAANKGVPGLIGERHASALAVGSGLVATLLTFLSPASRRKAYTEARNLLRVIRLRFEGGEENISVKDLNDAVEKAQEIITKK